MPNDQDVAVYIGLDWGDRAHAVQLQPAAGGPVEQLTLEQRPHVLHGWVAQLRERFGGRPVPCHRTAANTANAPTNATTPHAIISMFPPHHSQGTASDHLGE